MCHHVSASVNPLIFGICDLSSIYHLHHVYNVNNKRVMEIVTVLWFLVIY